MPYLFPYILSYSFINEHFLTLYLLHCVYITVYIYVVHVVIGINILVVLCWCNFKMLIGYTSKFNRILWYWSVIIHHNSTNLNFHHMLHISIVIGYTPSCILYCGTKFGASGHLTIGARGCSWCLCMFWWWLLYHHFHNH